MVVSVHLSVTIAHNLDNVSMAAKYLQEREVLQISIPSEGEFVEFTRGTQQTSLFPSEHYY